MRPSRVPKVDRDPLIKDAAKLVPTASRRVFLRNVASLGALALLTGCDIVDGPSSEKALRVISQFNDWVQARLFNPHRLAETFPESAHTKSVGFGCSTAEQSDHRQRRLLRARPERPRCGGAEKRDEIAPSS